MQWASTQSKLRGDHDSEDARRQHSSFAYLFPYLYNLAHSSTSSSFSTPLCWLRVEFDTKSDFDCKQFYIKGTQVR